MIKFKWLVIIGVFLYSSMHVFFITILTYIYTLHPFCLFPVESLGLSQDVKYGGPHRVTSNWQVRYQCHGATLHPWNPLWGIGNSHGECGSDPAPGVCCLICFRFTHFNSQFGSSKTTLKTVKTSFTSSWSIFHQQKLQHEWIYHLIHVKFWRCFFCIYWVPGSWSTSSSVISLSWVHRPKTWRMLHLWHRSQQLKATKLRSSDAGVGAGKKPCNFGRQRCLDGTEGSCERWDFLLGLLGLEIERGHIVYMYI